MNTKTTTISFGRVGSDRTFRYVHEDEDAKLSIGPLELTHREWDVTDPEARAAAARDELGDDYDWHVEHRSAQIWINPENNTAAIAVYRHPVGGGSGP